MEQVAHLWLFFAVVLGVVVLPGLDMAFVLASGLDGGPRMGLAAVAGIVGGGVCHVLMGALGIAVLLRIAPAAFNAMLVTGAAYIGWIGVSLFRSGARWGDVATAERRSAVATFGQGALTSLLNPKAYLFMLAIFPQFLRPEYGTTWVQVTVLWLIIACTQIAVYGSLAVLAGRARSWFAGGARAGMAMSRAIGVMLVVVAIYTGYAGWRAG